MIGCMWPGVVTQPIRIFHGSAEAGASAAVNASAAPAVRATMRMIADVFQDGAPNAASITYVVRKDSPIQKVEDLRGKAVATNAIGSFGDSAMRIMMRMHGLQDKDFTSVEVKFPNMPAMLDDKKVDLINLLPQYDHFLKDKQFRVLFTAAQGEGRIQAQLWAMREDYITAHRPALIDFFEDHIRAVEWLLSPGHHDEVVEMVAAVTKAKPQEVAYAYTKGDSYHAPDARPDIPGTQKAVDLQVQLGLMQKGLKVSPKYVDLSLVGGANKRLGAANGG